MTTTKETRAEKTQRRRRNRGSVHGSRLGVSEDLLDFDKFAYRWFNDTPGGARLFDKTKSDDWDIVGQDGGILKSDATDGAVSVIVGSTANGDPLRAYLCRKPKAYYDEDKAAKAAELEAQLNRMRHGGDNPEAAKHAYVPHSGIQIADQVTR